MFNRKSIHIVEDDEDIRYIIAYILSDMGYLVKVSERVTDFKQEIEHYKPDLFLLDVMLPDGNGLELCMELKTDPQTRDIPAIIMSAHATEEDVIKRACADDFIAKPFDLDELVELVKKYLPQS